MNLSLYICIYTKLLHIKVLYSVSLLYIHIAFHTQIRNYWIKLVSIIYVYNKIITSNTEQILISIICIYRKWSPIYQQKYFIHIIHLRICIKHIFVYNKTKSIRLEFFVYIHNRKVNDFSSDGTLFDTYLLYYTYVYNRDFKFNSIKFFRLYLI